MSRDSLTMTVEEAAKLLGISRSAAYPATARYRQTGGAEGIPNRKIGGRIVVLAVPLMKMLSGPVPSVPQRHGLDARPGPAQPYIGTHIAMRPAQEPDVAASQRASEIHKKRPFLLRPSTPRR